MKEEDLPGAVFAIGHLTGKSKTDTYKDIHEIVQVTLCAALKFKNLSISTVVMGIMNTVKTPVEAILYTKIGAEVILAVTAICHKFTEIEAYKAYVENYFDFADEEFIGSYAESIVEKHKEQLSPFYDTHVLALRDSDDPKETAKELAKALRSLNREQLYALAIHCAL